MIAGTLAVFNLPIRQFPAIAPPTIGINVNYPGSSAQTLQDTVVQVIEQQLNGIDNLDYLTADSNADGTSTITLTFSIGTDPDVAQVQVQNKLQLALPLLPQEVQQAGVRVNKPARNFLIVLGFISTDNSMRYRGGVDSYLGSLIAQRDMYDAQRALIVTRLAGAVNLVQLYQALGGGWKE